MKFQQASVPTAQRSTHSYDARNRLTFIDHPIGTSDISYSYFADGALHTAATATSTWSYSYDKRGLLRNETLATNGLSLPVNYSYTTLGHRASVQYPDGATINRLPNALGQASRAGNLATNASYHRNGALAGFTYGDGHVYSLALNTRQLPLQRSELRNGVQLLNYAYTYDGNGNVLTLLDQRPGGNETRTLAYDALNRMTQADAPGLLGFETYRYDALDNLRKAEFVGASRADLHITYGINAGNNRLSSIELAQGGTPYQHNYSHDARGNHTTGTTGVQAYTRSFNALNQMTAVFLPGQTDYYWYDAHGRRTTLQRNNQVTTQLYSRDGQLLYERSPAGVGTRHVYLGGRLVASTTGSTTTWQHTDHLGSPVRRTNAAGTQTGMTIFAPYGSLVAGTVGQGPGFTGHVNDTGSGLVYMQQRHYDPIAMRFVSVDPVHVDSGTGGNFNRYWYANNNPYTYIDPDGRSACTGTRIQRVCDAGGVARIQTTSRTARPFTKSQVEFINVTNSMTQRATAHTLVRDANRAVGMINRSARPELIEAVKSVERLIVDGRTGAEATGHPAAVAYTNFASDYIGVMLKKYFELKTHARVHKVMHELFHKTPKMELLRAGNPSCGWGCAEGYEHETERQAYSFMATWWDAFE